MSCKEALEQQADSTAPITLIYIWSPTCDQMQTILIIGTVAAKLTLFVLHCLNSLLMLIDI